MTRRILFAIAAGSLLASAAFAQSPPIDSLPRRDGMDLQRRQDGFVRVQSTISYFVAGPSGDSDEAAKLREKARQSVYAAAAHECDVLKASLASDCKLESVNSNINSSRQYGPTRHEGFTVNGSMSFRIILK